MFLSRFTCRTTLKITFFSGVVRDFTVRDAFAALLSHFSKTIQQTGHEIDKRKNKQDVINDYCNAI